MRQTRIYVPEALALGETLYLSEAPSRHVQQVLRLGVGAVLTLFNGDGRDYTAEIIALGRRTTQVRIDQISPRQPAPPLAITLALGIARGERMDFALQKAVELGVSTLVPLVTARTVVKLNDQRRTKRQHHWQGVIISACEQSGRCDLPQLLPMMTLEEWLHQAQAPADCLLLDPQGTQTLNQLAAPQAAQIGLLIGPEGGLTPEERSIAYAHGCLGVRLGPRILRAETAPLAAIAALQVRWGDFGL